MQFIIGAAFVGKLDTSASGSTFAANGMPVCYWPNQETRYMCSIDEVITI